MATKIEWAQQIKAAGLELPENWGKLSTSRAEVWKDKALAAVQHKPSAMGKTTAAVKDAKPLRGGIMGLGRAIGAVAVAMAGLAGATVETAASVVGLRDATEPPGRARTPQTKAATMPKDPKWRRRAPGSARGWYPVRKLADDPVPMTRQVRRAEERRASKMPVGASQALWHRAQGFGQIGYGRGI